MVPEFENRIFFSVVSISETFVLEVKEIFAAVKESPEKNLRLQWEALKASDFFSFFSGLSAKITFTCIFTRSSYTIYITDMRITLLHVVLYMYHLVCSFVCFFWLDAVFSSSSSSSCNSPPQFLQTTFVHEHKLL